MAKLDMGILGGFSGRVGTVVGYYRRGAWFVRAYQPHIKDRKSAAQLEQRSRFKAMIQFASPATPVLRVGLRQVAADWQITEGNAFLKINKECFPRESRNSRNTRILENLEILEILEPLTIPACSSRGVRWQRLRRCNMLWTRAVCSRCGGRPGAGGWRTAYTSISTARRP